ncbi:response regulator receiver modulated translation initiation factor IF-2 (plasmid) [Anabaenopsis circularis NIES-21]|uniref:Response regulator receiver modulated translation initiation factor IF-2 n=1 Tax=Anabaenopsis circularis NIES-21 TaxID=1085406 RepID=A0A1Z4GR57_9CYAN|nr:response regulator receiver modulated translation initiation factor IF-2 [Anabaenopsis circularis NIES-21]
MTRTATSSNEAKSKIAKRRIESFTKRFGEPHFYLACHAAFPLALTPDLLYHLWANFQQDVNSNLLNIPWIAVADLLLSNLCDEVGYELYEIDWAIRNELLNQLKDNPCFGQQRILELSNFLLAYMREQLNSSNPDIRDFAQAQKWTALAYAQPHEAAREIASSLASLNIENESEWLRLTSLIETLADPLAGYEPLLIYVRGMKTFVRGNVTEAKNFLNQVIDSKDEIKVAGVKLLIPDQLKAKAIPKISFKTKRHRWLIEVSLIVAVVGIGIVIWKQLNPTEFQQLWNSWLNPTPPQKISFNPPPPPKDPPPGGRVLGGAKRSSCYQVKTELTALVPFTQESATNINVWSLTTAAHPTFWFYIPYSQPFPFSVEFVLQDEQSYPIYQKAIALPKQPGIISISLPANAPSLAVDKQYRWFLAVYCDKDKQSVPVYVEGVVKRVNLDPTIAQELQKATSLQQFEIYAKHGIWHEALTILAQMRQQNPQDARLETLWQDLLASIRLDNVAKEPILSDKG